MKKLFAGFLIALQLIPSLSYGQRVIEADTISGQATVANLVKNGAFELPLNTISNTEAVGKWSSYDDTAATPSTCATDGTVTSTAVRSTGSSLGVGTNGLDITQAAVGEGFAYTFDVPEGMRGNPLSISFLTKMDANYAADSQVVYLYAVGATAGLKQPAPYIIKKQTIAGPVQTMTFQPDSDTTQMRLCFHQAVASTGHLFIDDLEISKRAAVYGAPVTNWASYTPTFGAGFGTVASVDFKSRRVGDSLEILGKWTNGTVAGNTATVSVGFGGANANVTIDTSKVPPAGIIGTAQTSLTSTTHFGVYPIAPVLNATAFGFTVQSSTTAYGGGGMLGNQISATGSLNSIHVIVPILGWSSSTQMSDSADTRVVAAKGTGGGGTISASSTITLAQISSVTKDTHGTMLTGASTKYTTPSAGWYTVSGWANLASSLTGTLLYGYGLNSSSAYSGIHGQIVNPAQYVPAAFVETLYLNAGDILYPLMGQTSAGTPTINYLQFVVTKVQGPSQIAASESVAARYYASATSVSGSLATVVWTTKDYDTHGALASGVFTCPVAGKYQVNTALALSGTFALNSQTNMVIQKNAATVSEVLDYAGGIITADHVTLSDTISCLAGDTLRVQVSSGATGPAIVSSNTKNFISISRIGL